MIVHIVFSELRVGETIAHLVFSELRRVELIVYLVFSELRGGEGDCSFSVQ